MSLNKSRENPPNKYKLLSMMHAVAPSLESGIDPYYSLKDHIPYIIYFLSSPSLASLKSLINWISLSV